MEGEEVESRPARGLLEVLQQVPDPRGRKGRRHTLVAMLATVVCATLCGFRGFRAIQQWLALHQAPMWHLLGYTRNPPKRQAFANLLARLDETVLERILLEFVDQLDLGQENPPADEALPVEVWDGKTLRGTRQGQDRAQQVIVRMQLALKRVLSSDKIPAGTNESKTALDLVRNLILKGRLIVGDAAYCQREICQEIVDQDGDYLVTVKDNQPQLRRDIEQAFVIPRSFSPLRTA